ncbi:MAG: NAD(P)/FAD-dependent oxidoreductase [Planctomycetota bacterium]
MPDSASQQYDAVVIGAGPSGSVTALRLAKAGWRVAVIEKTAFPRRKVCGEYLSGTNWRLLRELGIWQAFRDSAGPPIKRVAIFDTCGASQSNEKQPSGQVTAALPRAGGDPSEEWGRALTRDRLDVLLLEEAKRHGADVLQPAQCTAVDRCNTAWACEVTDVDRQKNVLQTPVVVAAHGAWMRSTLPTLPPSPPATDGDLLGFKAHFTDAALPADLMPLLSFPGGYGGMVTCQGDRVSLSCCVQRGVLDRLREETGLPAGEAVLAHIKQSIPAVRAALADATRQGEWLAAGPIRPGRRQLYREGIFAVGNAGGECHSVVAEGISMAMQSGWIAADALLETSNGQPIDTVEQLNQAGNKYTRRWSREFGGRLRTSSLVAQWAMRPSLVRLTQPVIRSCPPVLTLAARLAGKSRITCLK